MPVTADPVRDLAALGAAYARSGLEEPALHLAMSDAAAGLEDADAAGRSFGLLVAAAGRARDAGRFVPTSDPTSVALRLRASGHGLVMLVLTGVLPTEALDAQAPTTTAALCVGAGDDPVRCRASVAAGWSSPLPGP